MEGVERCLKVVGESQQMDFLVAFASDDRKQVNQHFGSADCFVVYGISKDEAKLLEVLQMKHPRAGHQAGHDESKLRSRIDQLQDVDAVYTVACGASATLMLKKAGIKVMMVDHCSDIHQLLQDLHKQYLDSPVNWMLKGKVQLERLAKMLEEEWEY